MPSPLGHALGGVIVGLLVNLRPSRQPPSSRQRPSLPATSVPHVAIAAVAACLPDLDFLWGRHNMETHSVGFAALVGLLVFAWQRSRRLAIASSLAVGTHVLFDWLGSDDTPPLGVMALWPFSNDFYFANAWIFQAISRRYWLPGFIEFNTLAVLRELAILGPIAGVLWWWRRGGQLSSANRKNGPRSPVPGPR